MHSRKRFLGLVAAFALLTTLALPALAADAVLAEGATWDKRTSKITGEWKIVQRGDRLYLQLGDDFKTKKAPDLKAFL
ncbi:MAG: hypothetical protein AAFX50_06990, partial [Acidobacteriota bacterium]